jgi:hypothetical protein
MMAIGILALWNTYFAILPHHPGFDPFFNVTSMVLTIMGGSIFLLSLHTFFAVREARMDQQMFVEMFGEQALFRMPDAIVLVEIVEVRIRRGRPVPYSAHTEEPPARAEVHREPKTATRNFLPMNWRIAMAMAKEWISDPFKWPQWLHVSAGIGFVVLVLALLYGIFKVFIWVVDGLVWLLWRMISSFFEAQHPLDYLAFGVCLLALIACIRWQRRTLPAALAVINE